MAKRRSVHREIDQGYLVSDESVAAMSVQLAGDQSSPSQQALRQELVARVRQAMTRLADRDREVLILIYVERLSVREASQTLDISQNTCSQRVLRAMHRLKDLLGGVLE